MNQSHIFLHNHFTTSSKCNTHFMELLNLCIEYFLKKLAHMSISVFYLFFYYLFYTFSSLSTFFFLIFIFCKSVLFDVCFCFSPLCLYLLICCTYHFFECERLQLSNILLFSALYFHIPVILFYCLNIVSKEAIVQDTAVMP